MYLYISMYIHIIPITIHIYIYMYIGHMLSVYVNKFDPVWDATDSHASGDLGMGQRWSTRGFRNNKVKHKN